MSSSLPRLGSTVQSRLFLFQAIAPLEDGIAEILKKGGGVDIFVRDGFRDVGLLEISESSERSRATLHTKVGLIL